MAAKVRISEKKTKFYLIFLEREHLRSISKSAKFVVGKKIIMNYA